MAIRAPTPPPDDYLGGSSDEDGDGVEKDKHLSEYLHIIGMAPDPEEERKDARKRRKAGLPPVVKVCACTHAVFILHLTPRLSSLFSL